jgi:polysaccharide export outer membrane protein
MSSKIVSDSSTLRRSRAAFHLLGLWVLFMTLLSSRAADSRSIVSDSPSPLPLRQSASAASLRGEGRGEGSLFRMSTKRPAIVLAQTFAPLNFSVPTNSPIVNGPVADPAVRKSYLADGKYKLRAGDRVGFQIMEDREPPKSLLVADSGELDIPYLGRISAADRTCKQLADELKLLLEKDYYYHATVVIGLDAANKFLGRIYVWGQVRNQGPIDIALNENLTAGKAVLRAGGFAEFANKKKVKLIRNASEEPNNKQIIELNMVAILEEGAVERDIVLQPDDLIVVPSRLINF